MYVSLLYVCVGPRCRDGKVKFKKRVIKTSLLKAMIRNTKQSNEQQAHMEL